MFTDTEYRILLSAMARERNICEEVDRKTIREPYEDSLLDICKSIDKKIHDIQNKYVWHDLRKNPDDLPEEGHEVLILVKNAYFLSRRSDYNYWSSLGRVSPKAWKEIEPFEEVE